uniref:Uncharacterized protein n=1 Tax=Rhabditophanes sp. KR3021 TaxID=114890 RepID=A0AC35UHM5_9BILA
MDESDTNSQRIVEYKSCTPFNGQEAEIRQEDPPKLLFKDDVLFPEYEITTWDKNYQKEAEVDELHQSLLEVQGTTAQFQREFLILKRRLNPYGKQENDLFEDGTKLRCHLFKLLWSKIEDYNGNETCANEMGVNETDGFDTFFSNCEGSFLSKLSSNVVSKLSTNIIKLVDLPLKFFQRFLLSLIFFIQICRNDFGCTEEKSDGIISTVLQFINNLYRVFWELRCTYSRFLDQSYVPEPAITTPILANSSQFGKKQINRDNFLDQSAISSMSADTIIRDLLRTTITINRTETLRSNCLDFLCKNEVPDDKALFDLTANLLNDSVSSDNLFDSRHFS